MGILGYRHSSYTLVDMRIHDINVVCDLSRRNPGTPDIPAPSEDSEEGTEYDGTTKGWENSPEAGPVYTAATSFSDDNSRSWWGLLDFWPVLHFLSSYVISTFSYVIHYTVDFLMNVNFVEASSDAYDGFVEFVSDWTSWAILALVRAGMQAACICYNAFDIAASTQTLSLITVAALGLAISASLGVFAMSLGYIENNVADGLWSHSHATYIYLVLAYFILRLLSPWGSLSGIIGSAVAATLGFIQCWTVQGAMDYVDALAAPLRIAKVFLLFLLAAFIGASIYHFLLW